MNVVFEYDFVGLSSAIYRERLILVVENFNPSPSQQYRFNQCCCETKTPSTPIKSF